MGRKHRRNSGPEKRAMANPTAHVGTRLALVRHTVALAGAGELGALGVAVTASVSRPRQTGTRRHDSDPSHSSSGR